MKKLFKRIKAWYVENQKYIAFKLMLFYAAWLPFMLAVMLQTGHTDFDSWVILALNACIGLNFAKDWRIEANRHEYSNIVSAGVNHLFELLESEAKSVRRWQDRCISANRRRKRAELALKKKRKMYRYAMERFVELQKKCIEYEDALLTAYTATYDYSVQASVSKEDIVRAKEARIRFNEYMGKHYEEMARNKFWREYKQDVFDCMYFPHSECAPEHYDGFYNLLQNGGNDGAVKETQENQEQ